MKKINIVKKNRDFSRIIKNNRPIKSNLFVIYLEKNTNDIYKFGISASKKVGNAVTRNRLKRQIKSILDKNTYKNNFNCIIIIKKDIIDKSFDEMSKDLNILINKLNIKEIK
ncbi:MAG: ribonuclease P protein component [Bacillales bacterium]|nr:ribonuclease P protein component [Bacillales bacterium]